MVNVGPVRCASLQPDVVAISQIMTGEQDYTKYQHTAWMSKHSTQYLRSLVLLPHVGAFLPFLLEVLGCGCARGGRVNARSCEEAEETRISLLRQLFEVSINLHGSTSHRLLSNWQYCGSLHSSRSQDADDDDEGALQLLSRRASVGEHGR